MLLVLPTTLRAQRVTLTDVIVDAISGTPVPFAVIKTKARRVGVQNTAPGTFTMDLSGAPAATASLRVSSLGFVPQMLAGPFSFVVSAGTAAARYCTAQSGGMSHSGTTVTLNAGYAWQQFKPARFLNKDNSNADIPVVIQPD